MCRRFAGNPVEIILMMRGKHLNIPQVAFCVLLCLTLITLNPSLVAAQNADQLWRVRAEYQYRGEPLILDFGLACSPV